MAGSDADEFNIWLGEFLDTADKPLALTFDEPAVLQQLVEEDLFGELLADVACCTASTTLAGSVRGSIAGTAAPGPPAPLLQHEQHPQQQAPTQPAPLLQQAAAAPKPTKREPRSTRHAKKRRDEVSTLEAEVRAKLAEIQQLQARNADLAARRDALEVMLGASSTNLELVSNRVAALSVADGPFTTSMAHNDSSATSNSSSGGTRGGSGSNSSGSSSAGHAGRGAEYVLSGLPDPSPVQLARQKQQRAENLKAAVINLRHVLAQLTQLLTELASTHDAAAVISLEERIGAMLYDKMTKFHHWSVGDPLGLAYVKSLNLATGKPCSDEERPDEEHWVHVAAAMQLSGESLRVLAAACNVYRDKLTPIIAERQRLLATIANTRQPAAQDIDYTSVLQQVQHTYMREHYMDACFQRSCCRNFLSPVQSATMMVQSYPWMADMEAVFMSAIEA